MQKRIIENQVYAFTVTCLVDRNPLHNFISVCNELSVISDWNMTCMRLPWRHRGGEPLYYLTSSVATNHILYSQLFTHTNRIQLCTRIHLPKEHQTFPYVYIKLWISVKYNFCNWLDPLEVQPHRNWHHKTTQSEQFNVSYNSRPIKSKLILQSPGSISRCFFIKFAHNFPQYLCV